MAVKFSALFLLSSLALASAAFTCPDPDVVAGFDVPKFEGKWYEYMTSTRKLEKGTKCNVKTYKVVNGTIETTYDFTKNGQHVRTNGLLVWDKPNGQPMVAKGTLHYHYPGHKRNFDYPFLVLAVQYDSFALVYGCPTKKNISFSNEPELAFVLTRRPRVTKQEEDAIVHAIAKANLTQGLLRKANLESCNQEMHE